MKDTNNDSSASKSNVVSAFSVACSTQAVFDVFYDFLKQAWNIVELDLFLTDNNKIFTGITNYRISGIASSVSLENTYLELEERGILEWVSQSDEIKVIPNIDDKLKQIKSIIIIPVSMFNVKVAFFLANSPLSHSEINTYDMSWPKLFANHASTLIAMLNVNKDKQIVSDSLLLLKKQAMLASNQIAASEIFIALSESFESPIKIIRANLEFIQKDVGDTKNRIKILVEQFNSLLNAQKLVHALFHEIESAPSQHSVYEIVEIATDIAKPFLTKNGIIVDYNYKDNEQSVQTVSLFGIKIQLIFALFNTIMYSISTMPEGGNISLMIDKNEESGKISIIIIDNGILTDKLGIDINNDGNLLYEIAASQQQESVLASENALPSELTQRQRQLLSLARHIITKHQGKFSAFSDEGKGTTYKITFPYI